MTKRLVFRFSLAGAWQVAFHPMEKAILKLNPRACSLCRNMLGISTQIAAQIEGEVAQLGAAYSI